MKFKEYIEQFNRDDFENVANIVPNSEAYEFLLENAPRFSCPDESIEKAFAFRSWTVRKHLKDTSDGVVMTEFLPDVPWAGKHNTINAPLFHQLNEYRWFKNADILENYLLWFLDNKGGNAYVYSTPALTAMYEFLLVTGNGKFIKNNADSFERYFLGWEEKHLTDRGLYYSIDGYDAMEFSISGTTPDFKALKGLRPTLNAYMYGDAIALSKIFDMVGNEEKSKLYREKADNIKKLVDENLYDGDFYKAIHSEDLNTVSLDNIPDEMNVRELIGYTPFAYGMPDADKVGMFKYLKDERVFLAPTGFATADRSHTRYMYEADHNCLWNGYVWPYATSITLNAVITLLNRYEQDVITDKDFVDFLHTYAQMHTITENGYTHSFIDEAMHPEKTVWTVHELVGNNRGKDYNHSTFIDIVIRGIVGIDPLADKLTVSPRIKGIWKWFALENITFKGVSYNVYYDEDGSKFGKGKGVIIENA